MDKGFSNFITSDNTALILIDYQPQMLMGVRSDEPMAILNNAAIIAKAAKLFEMPTILTTITSQAFAGPFMPELADVFPDTTIIDRTSVNAWLNSEFVKAVESSGRKRLVIAGLWTGACTVFNVLEGIWRGYEMGFVADACGDTTSQVHERSVERMIQQGAAPLTAQHFVYELQQDWAREKTYQGVMDLLAPHSTFGDVQVRYGNGLWEDTAARHPRPKPASSMEEMGSAEIPFSG